MCLPTYSILFVSQDMQQHEHFLAAIFLTVRKRVKETLAGREKLQPNNGAEMQLYRSINHVNYNLLTHELLKYLALACANIKTNSATVRPLKQ